MVTWWFPEVQLYPIFCSVQQIQVTAGECPVPPMPNISEWHLSSFCTNILDSSVTNPPKYQPLLLESFYHCSLSMKWTLPEEAIFPLCCDAELCLTAYTHPAVSQLLVEMRLYFQILEFTDGPAWIARPSCGNRNNWLALQKESSGKGKANKEETQLHIIRELKA